MTLTLTVDGERWRSHLRSFAEQTPGLVPVAKGNGYGLTLGRLARRTGWLDDTVGGFDTLAVGTYDELPHVATRYPGSLVVLTPWRPWAPALEPDLADRVIHTVSRPEDLPALLARQPRARVLLERMTSMRRHGMSATDLWETAAAARRTGAVVEGVSIHLPLEGGNLPEARALMDDVVGAEVGTAWVSHLTAAERAELSRSYADLRLRPRIGTALWLGDRGALRVTATVQDVHRIARGEPFGYRGRTAPKDGHLVVASGGTAHGIGLSAPASVSGLRQRAGTLAKGGLASLGLTRSPYSFDGRHLWFAEPPHMQASMLYLSGNGPVPNVGDELDVRVRFTATSPDRIVLT
ncbi:alanine racemase [Nocardioides insulae]|uniref:alanine racemase n=1 Tax=Nocardioides insulae TaxID=394734 RepID=UPI0003F8323A|nr:alanine racemase [Nocardioides insulae]